MSASAQQLLASSSSCAHVPVAPLYSNVLAESCCYCPVERGVLMIAVEGVVSDGFVCSAKLMPVADTS